MPDCLARIFDKTAAWLNPRSRKRFFESGTGTISAAF
jgi:hypothetical protein